jgi:hypothetical protein
VTKNRSVAAAIATIPEGAWTAVCYPGAVRDPDTGDRIFRCRGRRNLLRRFSSTPHAVAARLIVRRVKDARHLDALFPVWRYHPFLTDTTDQAPDADIARRRNPSPPDQLPQGPTSPTGKAGQTSIYSLHTTRNQDHNQPPPHDGDSSVDRGLARISASVGSAQPWCGCESGLSWDLPLTVA